MSKDYEDTKKASAAGIQHVKGLATAAFTTPLKLPEAPAKPSLSERAAELFSGVWKKGNQKDTQPAEPAAPTTRSRRIKNAEPDSLSATVTRMMQGQDETVNRAVRATAPASSVQPIYRDHEVPDNKHRAPADVKSLEDLGAELGDLIAQADRKPLPIDRETPSAFDLTRPLPIAAAPVDLAPEAGTKDNNKLTFFGRPATFNLSTLVLVRNETPAEQEHRQWLAAGKTEEAWQQMQERRKAVASAVDDAQFIERLHQSARLVVPGPDGQHIPATLDNSVINWSTGLLEPRVQADDQDSGKPDLSL